MARHNYEVADHVHQRAKVLAAENGWTLSEYVELAIIQANLNIGRDD